MITAATFAAVGIVLPVRYDGDGTLVDANDTVACQIDPNCEMDDNRVAMIGELIVNALNSFAGEDA